MAPITMHYHELPYSLTLMNACFKTLLIESYNFVYDYRFSQKYRQNQCNIYYQAYYLYIKGVLS